MGEIENKQEIEIKLRVGDAAHGWALIRSAGCRLVRERTFERNVLFDTAEQSLQQKGQLLRLRHYGEDRVVTFKGKSVPGRHKVREEIEFRVSDSANFQRLLEKLGYAAGFCYEKYRTEFLSEDGTGKIVLDETPVGVLLELEGPPAWIDLTAAHLGFSEAEYITMSYGALWVEDCLRRGVPPGDMVFGGDRR
ncbi:MAG: class IV adenylate cyclase [Bryobacterales bacterium]|nr:class IV adenylate cyclase [Bryobacterales bacterium]